MICKHLTAQLTACRHSVNDDSETSTTDRCSNIPSTFLIYALPVQVEMFIWSYNKQQSFVLHQLLAIQQQFYTATSN